MRLLNMIFVLLVAFNSSLAQGAKSTFSDAEREFTANNYKSALQLYTEVISIDGENMNAYLRRGFCRSVLRDYDKAIEDYSTVISKHPDHPFAYLSRGSAYSKKEAWELALADFDKVLSLDAENQEAYNNRGWAKHGMGLYKEACKDWKTSRKLGNEEAKIILKNNNCK